MDKNDKNEKIKDDFLKLLQMIGIANNDISTANKIYPNFYKYCQKLIELHLKNSQNSKIYAKKRQKNFNYIIKYFLNKAIGKNNNKITLKAGYFPNTIFIHFLIFYYSIFIKVSFYKFSKHYKNIKNHMLFELNELLSRMVVIFGKLYCDKIIDDDKFEIFLRLLIILSITSKKEKENENKIDNIANTMFLKECINIIKKVYQKIYETQNKFTEKQEKVINNIIIIIRENVITYPNEKAINIINKSFLSNNDYYTTSIIDLIFIISKMKNMEIIDNLKELLANIYLFSFKHESMMNSIIKILEPLLINLNIKKLEDINSELNISNFPIKLLNKMNEKEEMILKEDPTFLKKGFYLGNKVCGICGEIGDLKEDFMLIFGFALQEINKQKNNIKEWTLINIRNDKNESKLKISLLEIGNLNNQYNIIIKTPKKSYNTQIIVLSKKTYIFSFNFYSSFKGINLIIYYTDGSGSDNPTINEIEKLSIDNFYDKNCKIYIGCDIKEDKKMPLDLGKDNFNNNFTGYIGNLMILNFKKFSKKSPQEISKLILSLKGDYDSCILMPLGTNDNKSSFINNENKYDNQIKNKIIELNENQSDFVESLKMLISSESFKLIEYKDEIDYLNLVNNYVLYEEFKNEITSVRQNYLNLKQKRGSSSKEKMISIFSSFFNCRFHIFENKRTLDEFLNFDGIHYLCLLFEYYYQILSRIENTNDINESKENKDAMESINYANSEEIYAKIENNIFDLIKFFIDKILNKKYCKIYIIEINKFFYQMVITIKKYIKNNVMRNELFETIQTLISRFINFIKEEENNTELTDYVNQLKNIRNNLLDLLYNLAFSFDAKNDKMKDIECYLNIMHYLLKNDYLNDDFSEEFSDILLSIYFLFDNTNSQFNNKIEFTKLQSKYLSLMIEFLKRTYKNFLDKKTSKEKKEPVRKSLISKWKEKNIKEESNEPKPIENFLYLNKFFDKALENLNHEYIFSNLLTVIYLSELVDIADFKYIEQIQNILENNCENINKLKKSQLICEASLKILSKYYLGNKEKEDMIHTFLRGIPFYRGFFNCLISSLKQIKYIKFDNKFIQKESEKNLLSLIKENHSSKNIVTNYENEEQEELSTYNLYPFLELDFNSIDDNQNKILIKLLEDCISMLLKGENSITERDADEIFQSLINNFNIVLNFHGKNVYRDLFSSEKAITSEFFFIIWKLSKKEKKKALIMILKDYHKNLLRYHRYPFIYKFIQSIFSMEESKNQEDNQELIIDLFCFIVDQLEAIEKEKENTDDKKSLSYFVSNCVNLLILINNLVIKFDKLFENNLFYKGFFKLIIFIENTGILFSNYCFQINENIGKTIAEMCFDLLINLLNCSFSKELRDTFYNMFIIENRKDKEYLSIFYMTDLFREDLLMKEKLKAKFKNLVKNYDNLSYIQKNLFAKKKIYGKKPRQIIHINFSIYFLAKTFLYLDIVSDDLKNFFLNKFLIILSDNIYKLWTKRNSFYQHLICKHFPLYSYIKSFIEAHAVIQEPNINIYKKFFKELPEKLKNQAQVNNFNASRFFYEQDIEKENVEKEKNKEKKEWIMPSQNNFVNLPNINLDRMFKFEMLEKKNMIYNPKNYLMKIIFSSSFENIFFNDNLFKKIRASYLCKFRKNYSLNIKTKQLNYPTKQKNFSNSIEPKTFLRKDFNFYRKDFFSVSHEYIEEHLIKDEEKANLYFFPHNYYMDEIDNDINNLFECELITTQFLYFGQIKIGQKVFCFETKEDPRDKENFNPKKLDNKYFFSIKDNDNKTNKKKSIIIFIKDIKEILRRRNLLMKQAIEIFANNGKSFFFNFFKTENCEKVLHIFEDRKKELKKEKLFLLSNDNNAKYLSNILSQFKKGEISNYEYLLNLNKFSSRTYNDLTQYPIFPWLVLQIDDLYKITSVDSDIIEKENIRDMNYPVSMQEESKRIEEIIKYNEEDETIYRCHCGTHYSTSSYIFYYLMRTNPFGQNLIKLQNYKQENPNRMFLSFKETQKVLKSSTDNREMIPDLFCYVDYLCNVNCSFLGIRANSSLVDDFYINDVISNFDKNTNLITTYVECLYRQRKLLNDIFITKNLDKWVDIVFGKKQMPKNPLEAAKSCNTFSKYTYEQNINLENKLKKYQAKAQDKNMEKKLCLKLQNKINIINNFGICPIQILKETNSYEGNSDVKANVILNWTKEGNYIYFTKINNNHYLTIKEFQTKDKLPIRNTNIYEYKVKKEKYIFSSEYFEDDIPKIYMKNNSNSIPLYKINYSISHIIFIDELQNKQIFILTCRFLGNIFKVQNQEKTIMVSCEDFVTSIIARNSKENDIVFYTGLKNGKLTQWKIKIILKLNDRRQKHEFSSFNIEEKKHVYAHNSSITAIEINNSKQIIATSGEDKFIRIRKLYDFEILTSIDLTYSFGNSVISENKNIFPSLIKISDLNCIYVLLYDYKLNTTRIRGYTLNGLFFAQTDIQNLLYTNISFNKNWNIIAGVYNYNAVILLNSFNLKAQYQKRLLEENKTNKHLNIKWLEYIPASREFIILYNDEFQIMTLKDEEQKIFDY